MEENKEEFIDFKFEWNGRDFDKIAPNVLDMAKKLVELKLVKVSPELNENGNIVIKHVGVCKTKGLVECISSGIVNDDIYSFNFTLKPTSSLNCICSKRDSSKTNLCKTPSCSIVAAGYLYYLQNRKKEINQDNEDILKKDTEADIYSKNYNELKKMNFENDIEELLKPLALPNVKGLRCAFVGEEGTNKTSDIKNIAKYLYRIGKISSPNVGSYSLSYIGESQNKFTFRDDILYSIVDIKDYLSTISNNDDFSNSAEAGRKVNRSGINKLVNQTKGKYIIINATSLELKKLMRTNSKLPYIFNNKIFFKDYEDKRILEILENNLSSYHKNLLNERTREFILSYLQRNRKYFPFKNEDLALFLAGYISRRNEINLPEERFKEITLDEMFKDIIGMNNIKHQIKELRNFLLLRNKLEKQGVKFPPFNLHMMFLGNPGTGKTTVARMIAKILFDLGYIKENKCIEVESKDLIAAYSGQTPLKTGRVINSALGGILFIDEAYTLTQSRGEEVVSTLVKAMEDNKEDLVVIFAGYSKEMQEFIHLNSGIKSRIGYTFEFADYTEDELYDIYKLKASKMNLEVGKDAEEKLRELISFGRNRENFGNGRYVDNILQKTLTKHSNLKLKEENILKLTSESIPSIEEIITQSSGERKPDEIEEIFEDIIGMDDIKQQVIELGKYIKFRDELSKISENKLPDFRLHMLFLGDAGTGKTTMARKITEMLYNIGCIRINKLTEVERKDLVAEYVGQTAKKTQKVIEGAMGGVLFIDEAYSLTPQNSENDFGQEAIATLIKAMEDYRDELVIIFAGYKKEMKRFVNSNSGIASRIGYTFKFKNYRDEELYKIFEVKCKKYNLIINDDVKEKVMEIFKFFSFVQNYGNGRFVDKLLQEILIKHAQNENMKNSVNTLFVEDVPTIKYMVDRTFNNRENITIPEDVTMENRRRIAVHEIGHAIVHYIYKGEVNIKVITVIPEAIGTLGYVLYEISKEEIFVTRKTCLEKIEELLAGRASEEIFFGKNDISTGCYNDLEKANNELSNILETAGMSESIGLLNLDETTISQGTKQELDIEKKKILNDCYDNVKKLLINNKAIFDKVIDYLMKKGTITGEEFANLVK